MAWTADLIDRLNHACPALGGEFGPKLGTFLESDSEKLTSIEATADSIEATLDTVSEKVTSTETTLDTAVTKASSVETTLDTASAKLTSVEATTDGMLPLAGGTMTGVMDFDDLQMFSVVFSGTSDSIVNANIGVDGFVMLIPLNSGAATMMQSNPPPYISSRSADSCIITHADDNGTFGVFVVPK